jgi:hypothetical protein
MKHMQVISLVSVFVLSTLFTNGRPASAQEAGSPSETYRSMRPTVSQPFRVKVGGMEYDFDGLLKLKPSDTNNATVETVVSFDFHHPGLLNDLKELEVIKQKIAAGEQPWATEFKKMKGSPYGALNYLAKMAIPPATISSDFNDANDQGLRAAIKDANAAYTQALLWCLTGDETYAKNAAGILEIYAANVVDISAGKNWYLNDAWLGSVFPNAAELLRATYPQWENSRVIGKWFNDVFLPPLFGRVAFGNRAFDIINAMAAIGVYNNDVAAFYLAMNHWVNYIPAYHYLPGDGAKPYLPDYWVASASDAATVENSHSKLPAGTPGVTPTEDFLLKLNAATFPKDWTPWLVIHDQTWSDAQVHGKLGDDLTTMRKSVVEQDSGIVWAGAPVTYLQGYCAETARDLGHSELSFASEINAAEIAWHQGVDVYTPQTERLTTFMETEAKLRLGEPPPESMTAKLMPYGLAGGTFEIAYNHYANRLGMPLPYTAKIIEILRQAGVSPVKPIGQDAADSRLWDYAPPFPPLFASNIGGSVGWISSWETLTHANLGNR